MRPVKASFAAANRLEQGHWLLLSYLKVKIELTAHGPRAGRLQCASKSGLNADCGEYVGTYLHCIEAVQKVYHGPGKSAS